MIKLYNKNFVLNIKNRLTKVFAQPQKFLDFFFDAQIKLTQNFYTPISFFYTQN